MGALPQITYTMTEAEYLEFERNSEYKHEFVDGEVYAMAGASANHIIIATNITVLFGTQFQDEKCIVLQSDMRVKVQATKQYFYPDASVVCGERHFAPEAPIATLINPIVIVEVLSPSTELYDRTTKRFQYQTIPSLQDYILVSQQEHLVERYSRHKQNEWINTVVLGLESSIKIPSVGCTFELSSIYRNVAFEDGDVSG